MSQSTGDAKEAVDETLGATPEVSSSLIRLRTTERGLPVAMTIAPRALAMSPDELARHVTAMCELSARRAQVSRRRDLLAAGFAPAVVDGLDLATAENLRGREAATCVDGVDDDPEELPATWMREA